MAFYDTTVTGLINDIVDTAITFRDDAIKYIDRAVGFYPQVGGSAISTLYPPTKIDGKFLDNNSFNANQFVFNQDQRNAFEVEYEQVFGELKTRVPKEFHDFLTEFFPLQQSLSKVETQLFNIIDGKGLPLQVKQEWNKARDRDLLEAQRLEDEAYSSAAAKGFSMPPLTTQYRVLMAHQTASNNLSATNRDIAIESAKMQIDLFKFAVDKAISLRELALKEAMDYINLMYKEYEISIEKAKTYVESYQIFYNSMNAYYNSVNEVNRLKFQVQESNLKYSLEDLKLAIDSNMAKDNRVTNSLLESSRITASVASSALSGINALVTNSTSQTTAT